MENMFSIVDWLEEILSMEDTRGIENNNTLFMRKPSTVENDGDGSSSSDSILAPVNINMLWRRLIVSSDTSTSGIFKTQLKMCFNMEGK
jgi:hypothetical protein